MAPCRGEKTLDFLLGVILQPLLGCQRQLTPALAEPVPPFLVHEDRCRQTEEYMGKRPRWRVLWPLPGNSGFKAPGGDRGAGACALPLYPFNE